MDEILRVFTLPASLLDAFERDLERNGVSPSQAVRAAVLAFLQMSPAEKAACLKRLDERVPPETLQPARIGRPPGSGTRPPPGPRQRIVVTGKILRLQIPPPERQRTIG